MIKLFQTCLFLLFAFSAAKAQSGKTFYKTSIKHRGYYVVLSDDSSFVYKLGAYISKNGMCAAVLKTIPLWKDVNSSYIGDSAAVVMEGGKHYLDLQMNKLRRGRLKEVHDTVANNDLNSAYFMANFFIVEKQLEDQYPLANISWSDGFNWLRNMPFLEIDYIVFRGFADEYLKEMSDSVVRINDRYTANMNYLLENIETISYAELNDSLDVLYSVPYFYKKYVNRIAKELSKKRPEYYITVGLDYQEYLSTILFVKDESEATKTLLNNTEGYKALRRLSRRHYRNK